MARGVLWWVVVAMLVGGCHAMRGAQPPLALPVAWQVGDRLAVEIVKERTGVERGKKASLGRGVFPVDVEVASRTGDAYVLFWTYGPARLDGGPKLSGPAAAFVRRLSTLLDGRRLVISVKPLRGETTIVNLDEVTGWYRDGMEEVHRHLLEEGMPVGDAQRLMTTVAAFGRPESVAAASLEQPRLFLRFVGARLERGEVVEYHDRLPIELGGEPIPTTASYVLEAVDTARHEARIAWRQRLDEEAARTSTFAMLQTMAERMGKPAPKPTDVPVITIEDRGEWVMNTVSGWPLRMSFARKSMAGEGGRIEATTMTAQPQGAAR